MASTRDRMTARGRARAAQQKVLTDRKARDEKNMGSLTDYFAAAEQIDAAKLAMARALDDIRSREGTLAAAATLAGITTGEARKLLTLLTETATTPVGADTADNTADSAPGSGALSNTERRSVSATHTAADTAVTDVATTRDAAGDPDDATTTDQG